MIIKIDTIRNTDFAEKQQLPTHIINIISIKTIFLVFILLDVPFKGTPW